MLVALLLLSAVPWLAADDAALAPDGRRGFGAQVTARELEQLIRSNEEEDVAYLTGLANVGSDVRILVATLAEDYRQAGYFQLLPDPDGAGLPELHAAVRGALDLPLSSLRAADPRGEAFARVALDARLRVRMRALADWEREAEELRAGLAVLNALAAGYVLLSDEEARIIARRLDLAGSRLRALRNDLAALRPQGAAGVHVSREEALDLLRQVREEPDLAAREAWDRAARRVEHDTQAMAAALFTTRLDAIVAAQLEWRDEARARARALYEEAEALLPDTPAGKAAPAKVQDLSKHRRIQLALDRARAGLAMDPLDEELAYVAAWSSDYLWGSLESRPLYDRFLALRGIRLHDHRTLRDRPLTPREETAMLAVQREALAPR